MGRFFEDNISIIHCVPLVPNIVTPASISSSFRCTLFFDGERAAEIGAFVDGHSPLGHLQHEWHVSRSSWATITRRPIRSL